MDVRRVIWVLALVTLGVAGCAGHRTLETKSAAVPAGVDLSGRWRLRGDGGDTKRRDGTLVQLFLTTGKSLKITQTDAGLFISFDRAIVEEYRFGENREVQIGAAKAQRASGWEGKAYAIETLDEDDALLTETYRLADGGKTLVRTIRIAKGSNTLLDVRQTFDRV
jgi:hypothetical protein